MLMNLLTNANKFREVGIGEASIYALLGYLVVFLGIFFLIFVVWMTGKVISKNKPSGAQSKKPEPEKAKEETIKEAIAVADSEEVSEETLAVITAALMAYYEMNNPKCEFTIKRIKRLNRI